MNTDPMPWQNEDYICKGCGTYDAPPGDHSQRCKADCPELEKRCIGYKSRHGMSEYVSFTGDFLDFSTLSSYHLRKLK